LFGFGLNSQSLDPIFQNARSKKATPLNFLQFALLFRPAKSEEDGSVLGTKTLFVWQMDHPIQASDKVQIQNVAEFMAEFFEKLLERAGKFKA